MAQSKKEIKLDELINIPTKAGERFVQEHLDRHKPEFAPNFTADPRLHCVFKMRESARFTAKIHNPCAFEGQIPRSENLFTFTALLYPTDTT